MAELGIRDSLKSCCPERDVPVQFRSLAFMELSKEKLEQLLEQVAKRYKEATSFSNVIGNLKRELRPILPIIIDELEKQVNMTRKVALEMAITVLRSQRDQTQKRVNSIHIGTFKYDRYERELSEQTVALGVMLDYQAELVKNGLMMV